MAITVHINTNGVLSQVEVPQGVTIDFSHPGSPMMILDVNRKVLLVVHPHQWVYAEATK